MAAAAVDLPSLGERYKQQLVQTGEMVREKSVNAKQQAESTFNEWKAKLEAQREQLQPQAMAIVEVYKNAVKDIESPVPANASPFLLKSYLWTGACLLAEAVSRNIGAMFLFPLATAIFDTWTATLLTYVAFPVFVFLTLRKVQMSEVEREQLVLLASVAEGALVGALFSNRYATIYGPPLFLFPTAIGLVAHFAGAKEQVAGNRRVFLGALLGGAMIGYVVYGFIFNFNLAYLLSVLVLGAAAAADLQLKVASFVRGDSSPQLEQWKTVVIMTIAGAVAQYIGSISKEQANTIAAETKIAMPSLPSIAETKEKAKSWFHKE